MNRLARLSVPLLGLFALLAVIIATNDSADASELRIELQPGSNTVTWNSAEPYAIDNFVGTPITQVHRWDAIGQSWLSRFVGKHEATLPELHLLPRVQYLLVAEGKYELDVPDAVAEIDPHAELRFADPPDDPLRIEAYWPNEDSPLDDLVVLRGEDERLSVEAEIAGGVGDVSVWWVIDGRVNYAGLASDDVDLEPGAHDHGRLYAVDESGQVVVVEMPRVVKLPPLVVPEMQFGVLAHIGTAGAVIGTPFPYKHMDQVRAALDLMLDAGLSITMSDWQWNPDWGTVHFDGVAHELHQRDMDVIAIAQDVPKWASAMDVTMTPENTAVRGPWGDPNDKSQEMTLMANSWPTIRYWMVAHESNLNKFYLTGDTVRLVDEIRAAALAAYYANPQAIMVGPGLTLPLATASVPGEFVTYPLFLQALYDLGWRRYVDVVAIHPFVPWAGDVERTIAEMMKFVDGVRAIMAMNGDGDGVLWATSHGWNTGNSPEGMSVPENIRAKLQVAAFRALAERRDVSTAIIYNFMDTWMIPGEEGFGLVEYDRQSGSFIPKPSYWAVREFLTGKPPLE